MEDEHLEEETYSLILTSLKHPLRRKILRILSKKPSSFSEIQESLAIDSGHLNYHLKNLGDLITHTQEGNYTLSTAGWAGVRLMGKVEEQEKNGNAVKRNGRTSKTAVVFSAIFAVCLLVASFYALTYVSETEEILFKLPDTSAFPKMITIGAGSQYNFNIFFVPLNWSSFNRANLLPPIANSVPTPRFIYAEKFNLAAVYIAPPNNSITHWIKYFSNTSLSVARAQDAKSIDVVLYNPNNTTFPHVRAERLQSGVLNILQGFELSDFGTYRFQFKNLGNSDISATLYPYGSYIKYSKPLFYYGILILSILILYPILFISSWKWKGKRPAHAQSPQLSAQIHLDKSNKLKHYKK